MFRYALFEFACIVDNPPVEPNCHTKQVTLPRLDPQYTRQEHVSQVANYLLGTLKQECDMLEEDYLATAGEVTIAIESVCLYDHDTDIMCSYHPGDEEDVILAPGKRLVRPHRAEGILTPLSVLARQFIEALDVEYTQPRQRVRYAYDYYDVTVPIDLGTNEQRAAAAIDEARERTRLYAMPAEWSANVWPNDENVRVRRKRRKL